MTPISLGDQFEPLEDDVIPPEREGPPTAVLAAPLPGYTVEKRGEAWVIKHEDFDKLLEETAREDV
jgi:hypothetical protein